MQSAPPEFCLFFVNWWPMCMAKGEWASWAQAIGSVAAIGVAIWVPWNLQRREARAQLFAVDPYVAAGSFCPSPTMPVLGVTIKNFGRSPALRLIVESRLGVDGTQETGGANPLLQTSLSPTDTADYRVMLESGLTDHQHQAIVRGDSSLDWVGQISYLDVFGAKRISRFSYSYRGRGMVLNKDSWPAFSTKETGNDFK
jgi:hypothetical protein